MSAVSVEEVVAAVSNRGEAREVTQEQKRAERKARRLLRNPYRREQFRRHVRRDQSIIRGALVTLDEMLEHSDKTLDGAVWPGQERLAAATGYDKRTVQRHIEELEKAGYLVVVRSRPVRDPVTGKYQSRRNNRYWFRFAEPGGGQRVSRNRTSHLDDTGAARTVLGIETPRPSGGGGVLLVGFCDPNRRLKKKTAGDRRWSDEKGCPRCDRTGWIEHDDGSASRCGCT